MPRKRRHLAVRIPRRGASMLACHVRTHVTWTRRHPGQRNRALHPVRVPSESQGWFMPFSVPAHGTARRSVLFEGEDAPRLDRVEARRSSPASNPADDCTVRQSGLAGP